MDTVLATTALTQKQMRKYFKDAKSYHKTGHAQIRKAVEGEKIDTVVDGKTETTNTAKKGDLIVKGSGGEEYILTSDKFKGRYVGPKMSKEFQKYKAVGMCYATEWKGEPVIFMASWGEKMIIEQGDMLCSPSSTGSIDLYRIEKKVFASTYKPGAA